MNINSIPVIGWILSLIVYISLSIPFWLVWTVCGIGEKFFYFVPSVYYNIGFWETVGVFTAVSILKSLFVPKFVNVSQSNK